MPRSLRGFIRSLRPIGRWRDVGGNEFILRAGEGESAYGAGKKGKDRVPSWGWIRTSPAMHKINFLGYLAIPLAFVVHLWLGKGKSWEPMATFALAALGVIPLAHLLGQATEHLSERPGPTWGGLLNATFGNAAELIIAIIALTKGMNEVVKASLTGSILGNLLLVGGAAMVAGGWKREKQIFNRDSAEANGGLL